MAGAQKIRWAQLRVGLMAVAAIAITAVLVMLLTGTKKLFSSRDSIYTFMDDSVALANGSPVRLNGILVGKVNKVELSGDRNPQRIIRIEMQIDRPMMKEINVDSVAAISAENVL